MGELSTVKRLNDMDAGPIALGTMRFADKGRTKEELVSLFSFLLSDLNIDIHHSSYEYSSYPLYCEALAAFKKKAKEASGTSVKFPLPISKSVIFQPTLLQREYKGN
jgi:hypothetical protein